jgi:PDZ domain-containing secreted protein
VGSDGLIKSAAVNEARFDHNPVTGESLGLLIEESRTNLLTNSSDYTQSNLTKFNLIVGTGGIAPDGSISKKVSATTANDTHGFSTSVVPYSQLTYYSASYYFD